MGLAGITKIIYITKKYSVDKISKSLTKAFSIKFK